MRFSHLPWRADRSLYHTLVSEIMLQQTTVPTVLPRFLAFIEQFPTITILAHSSEEEVLIAWKGLGYYRRARHLHRAAQIIVDNFFGEIPLVRKTLKEIAGIGDYTADAILAIGHNNPILCIDANLERVLSRYYQLSAEKGSALKTQIRNEIEEGALKRQLHATGGRAINEALMDLGREICLAQRPRCSLCPLQENCLAQANNRQEQYPVLSAQQVKKKNDKPIPLSLLRLVIRQQNKIHGEKRAKGKWLEGQFELPTFILKSDDPNLLQYFAFPEELKHELPEKIPFIKSVITKYRITNYYIEISLTTWKKWLKKLPMNKENWQLLTPLELANLSTTSQKILKTLIADDFNE